MKRFIILLTIVCLVISSGTWAAFAEGGGSEAYGLLFGLGIMEKNADGTYDSQKEVTRSEFAKIICKLMNVEKDRSIFNPFIDLEDENVYAGYITTLNGMGIMIGYDSTRFGPNDKITYEQALRTLIKILGYTAVSNQYESLTTLQKRYADTLGLTAGIKIGLHQPLTNELVARLADRALKTMVMTQVNYGEIQRFSVTKGATLLTERHEVYQINGIVEKTSISDPTAIFSGRTNGKVTIQGITMNDGFGANAYLGYRVKAYYSDPEESSSKTLLYLEPDLSSTEVIEVLRDDITSYGNFTYNYREGRGQRTADIPSTADVIFNGCFVKSADRERALNINTGLFRQGKMTLIYLDGKLSTVRIDAYETYLVSDINLVDKKIFGKYNADMINLSDEVCYHSIEDVSGRPLEISALAVNMMLNVYKSISGNLVHIIASNTKVTGTVDERYNDTETPKLVINGQDYIVDKTFYGSSQYLIDIGAEYIFYIDSFGRIGGASTQSGAYQYGFLMHAMKGTGLSAKINLKILDRSGEQFAATVKTGYTIDGEHSNNPDYLLTKLMERAAISGVGISNSPYGQLIRYMKDSAGEISIIDTAYVGADEGEDTLTVNYLTETTNLIYKNEARSLGGKILVNDDTSVFVVPTAPAGQAVLDERYKVSDYRYFQSDGNYDRLAALSSTPDALVSECIVRYAPAGGSIVDSSKFALVTGIKSVLNKAGDPVEQISVIVDGNGLTFITEEAGLLKNVPALNSTHTNLYDVNVGDVIKYALNADNEISTVRMALDVASGDYTAATAAFGESGSYNTSNRLYYGNVFAKVGHSVAITAKPLPGTINRASDLELFDTSRASVFLYDSEDEKVYESGLAEVYAFSITQGDNTKALIFTNYATMRMFVIYK